MLRVGLTGGLGSGKSTAARLFAEHGAHVLGSDDLGRELMQQGEAVYTAIIKSFGPGIVLPDGSLDRAALARMSFEQGRVEELNGIVHPAVITRQERLIEEIAASEPDAIVVIESALIFETKFGGPGGWRKRFDKMVLITAPETLKVARFLERAGATAETRAALEAEAHRRLALQMPDEEKAPFCDYVLHNDRDITAFALQVEQVWQSLVSILRRL